MNPDRPVARTSSTFDVTRLAVAATVLALVAAAMWFAWLGWDDDYYLVDGVPQGPYRAWQVVGCGLSVAVATVLAHLRAPGVLAIFVLAGAASLGFAVPWAVHAAATDDSGLWVVGLLFLLVGAGVALTVLLTVTSLVTTAVSQRRDARLR